MSRRAKMVLDKEFRIAPVDKRIYASLSIWDVPCTKASISRDIRLRTRTDSVRTWYSL